MLAVCQQTSLGSNSRHNCLQSFHTVSFVNSSHRRQCTAFGCQCEDVQRTASASVNIPSGKCFVADGVITFCNDTVLLPKHSIIPNGSIAPAQALDIPSKGASPLDPRQTPAAAQVSQVDRKSLLHGEEPKGEAEGGGMWYFLPSQAARVSRGVHFSICFLRFDLLKR